MRFLAPTKKLLHTTYQYKLLKLKPIHLSFSSYGVSYFDGIGHQAKKMNIWVEVPIFAEMYFSTDPDGNWFVTLITFCRKSATTLLLPSKSSVEIKIK